MHVQTALRATVCDCEKWLLGWIGHALPNLHSFKRTKEKKTVNVIKTAKAKYNPLSNYFLPISYGSTFHNLALYDYSFILDCLFSVMGLFHFLEFQLWVTWMLWSICWLANMWKGYGQKNFNYVGSTTLLPTHDSSISPSLWPFLWVGFVLDLKWHKVSIIWSIIMQSFMLWALLYSTSLDFKCLLLRETVGSLKIKLK